ncbi:putative bifunctional diguanylate cyclase/phosphodiesterase [Frateuria defendens]|uniref:putative bifunctional diguanylate cyclase/phosphodiesterase n=1 Tax=Frateuria defendens TaxID=2219559 RepID=UPI00069E4752|nr:EAL domain-containing protein [Frateuria defendens]
MPTTLMATHYDLGVVALSLLVAAYASYVALDLARRVRGHDAYSSALWTIGGALVLGSGIWSMHFVGMMAMRLPIETGYDPLRTLFSWAAAVTVSMLALRVAACDVLRPLTLLGGALAMGAGISAMHYTGMAALELAPPIVWRPGLVALSVLIACAASASALVIFFAMRRLHGLRARAAQVAAALVMGAAISGMHYTGMAAADFPIDALCLSADGLGGRSLATMVVLATLILLSLTLFTSILDARLHARASRLADSLQSVNEQLQDANAELQRLAFMDPLTDLANRALFEERLREALDRVDLYACPQHGKRLAVLFIDLDGFKPINDSYGHGEGDAVLRQVAARLHAAARGNDTAARVGGDEFVLLQEDIDGVTDAVALAGRVLHALAQPYQLSGRQVTLSCSIGVAVYPDHGHRDMLMTSADVAMYVAKRAGGSTYAVFEPQMHADARQQMELQQALRGAGERGELQLHYQPKIDSLSGRTLGLEALLRWEHPQLGPISPSVFIPVAERFGQILAIGDWVIDEACRQLAAWRREGTVACVAINLSMHQLRQPDLAARMRQMLQRHGVVPSQLICEITETVAMDDTEAIERVMQQLTELGVELSIDDFGTGYSSLAYLRKLRVQQLKIDAGFVRDLASSGDARAVVSAVVRLAHALGLRVVAEGVETGEQRTILVDMGCDELQGFYFAQPMTAQALEAAGLLAGRA